VAGTSARLPGIDVAAANDDDDEGFSVISTAADVTSDRARGWNGPANLSCRAVVPASQAVTSMPIETAIKVQAIHPKQASVLVRALAGISV
jgi:hypothetical protein